MRSFLTRARRAVLIGLAVACCGQTASAGYNRPAHIDGCRSANGRFEIVAEAKVKGPSPHGPHEWEFVWKDNKTGATHRMPAQGIQGGVINAQLFIAPDGETFALWNHMIQYWPTKSQMSSTHLLPMMEQPSEEEKFRGLDVHKKNSPANGTSASVGGGAALRGRIHPALRPLANIRFEVSRLLPAVSAGSVMKAIRRMSPPHAGHSSGNSSATRARSFAQAIRDVSCEGLAPAAQQSVPVPVSLPFSLQPGTGTCSCGTRASPLPPASAVTAFRSLWFGANTP